MFLRMKETLPEAAVDGSTEEPLDKGSFGCTAGLR